MRVLCHRGESLNAAMSAAKGFQGSSPDLHGIPRAAATPLYRPLRLARCGALIGHERPYPEVTVSDRSLTPSTQTSHLCFSVRPRQGNRHFGHLPRVGKKLKVELKKGPRSRPRLSSSTPGLTLSSMKLTSIGVRHNT